MSETQKKEIQKRLDSLNIVIIDCRLISNEMMNVINTFLRDAINVKLGCLHGIIYENDAYVPMQHSQIDYYCLNRGIRHTPEKLLAELRYNKNNTYCHIITLLGFPIGTDLYPAISKIRNITIWTIDNAFHNHRWLSFPNIKLRYLGQFASFCKAAEFTAAPQLTETSNLSNFIAFMREVCGLAERG